MYWLMSANAKIYDHASSFEHYNFIDWRQGKVHFSVGDIVYIYCTTPLRKIRYKCEVKKLNMDFSSVRDDKEYWLDQEKYAESKKGKFFRLALIEQLDNDNLDLPSLIKNGLKSAPQGPIRLTDELHNYIESVFDAHDRDDYFPDTISAGDNLYEGIKKQITVNKYERSSIARAKCIEYHGCICSICSLNFEHKYGEIGANFIHVHHVRPLYSIAGNYKIDYKNDLIPVCPNCHAMLHRTLEGKSITIDELKKLVQSKRA